VITFCCQQNVQIAGTEEGICTVGETIYRFKWQKTVPWCEEKVKTVAAPHLHIAIFPFYTCPARNNFGAMSEIWFRINFGP
jgi:hypothetical protein